MLKVCITNKKNHKAFLTNKQNIISYVNNILCSKLLNNNFQYNSIYQHLIKTSKF